MGAVRTALDRRGRLSGAGEAPAAEPAGGAAELRFARDSDGVTRLAHLYQRAPLRVLFPRGEPGEPPVAVIVTISGGLVAGDLLSLAVAVGAGGAAHLTAAAAEKIYRSTGATSRIAQRLSAAAGAWLEYLPPETILFDGARLRRHSVLDLAAGAGFLGGGILVFGRRARGERLTHGLLHDRWEVWRDGALLWADALHLEGDTAAIIADPACFGDAAACATLVLAPPSGDPAPFLDRARDVVSVWTAGIPAACGPEARGPIKGLRGGVTAVGGLVVARWLAADPRLLRRAFADLACHLRAAAMGLPPRLPRLWQV